MAQIPAIDQFRWPGYFNIIYSFLLGVVTMVWFREKRGDVQKKGGPVLPKHLPIPLYVSLSSPELGQFLMHAAREMESVKYTLNYIILKFQILCHS